MQPLAVAAVTASGRWRRLRRVPVQPLGDIEIEELLAPDQAGKCLALDRPPIGALHALLQLLIELVGFAQPALNGGLEVRKGLVERALRQAQLDAAASEGGDLQRV